MIFGCAARDHKSERLKLPTSLPSAMRSFAVMSLAASALAFAPSSPQLRRSAVARLTMSAQTDSSVLQSRRQFVRTSAAVAALTAASPATYAKGSKNSVSFANVKDGDTVPRKFVYKFEVSGYELSPAADGLKEGTGHHHLVIDGSKAFVDKGEAIPFDATHKHFGKAQTEGELELEPGKHKITLQFANANHESYGKEFAKTITVNVKDA